MIIHFPQVGSVGSATSNAENSLSLAEHFSARRFSGSRCNGRVVRIAWTPEP